jgi:hypothetical protein
MPQWFDPLNDTPVGRLLKDVKELSKAVEKKKEFPDLNNDGKTTFADILHGRGVGKKGKKGKKDEGYKSDRGDGPKPKLPSPKKDKTVIKFDSSDNCPNCGANPHEECGKMGMNHEMRAIDCMKNPVAFDSRFDDMRQHSMREHIDEGHPTMIVRRSDDKNTECGMCKNVECMGDCGGGMKKADMKEKNKYCQKHFGCNYSECTSKQKAQCDRECGKGDEVKKYEKEPSLSNSVPTFQNVDGGTPVRATGFTTNQRIPHFEDGVKKTIVSESAKIPAYAQTGYANTSSSLHMHLTDGGNSGTVPNIASIEESLATLTKGASRAEVGTISEIESLLKQIKERTQQ